MNTNRTEKGQALILIVLAIVGIFAFAALALDIGRIFTERRRTQSAADSAALTAAFTSVNGGDPLANAYRSALTNGFDNNGTTNRVSVHHPPVSGPYAGDTQYYQVIIWQHVDPIFAQIFFRGQEAVTTEAVARARPISGTSVGNAIHSLDPSDDSMVWNGNVDIHVIGGNIFSNGVLEKTGTSGDITVDGGKIYSSDDFVVKGHPNIYPEPEDKVPPQVIADIPMPYCPEYNDTYNGVNYYYHSGLTGSTTLQPGFHCFYGDIKLTGNDRVKGKDVMLVMMKGGISMKGNSVMDLKRPNDIVNKNGEHYGGLLIYAPPSNTATFELGGTSDSYFTGSVIAPRGICDIGGTPSGTGQHMALICWQVRNHGTADLFIKFREKENYRLPAIVELSQ